MKVKQIIKFALIAASAVCGIIGGILILGAIGRADTDPAMSCEWFVRQLIKGAALFLPGVVTLMLEDVLEDGEQ